MQIPCSGHNWGRGSCEKHASTHAAKRMADSNRWMNKSLVHALTWPDDVACLPCRPLASSVVPNIIRSTRCNIAPQSDFAAEDFHIIAVLCNIPAAPFEEQTNTRFPGSLANLIESEVCSVFEIGIDCNRCTK